MESKVQHRMEKLAIRRFSVLIWCFVLVWGGGCGAGDAAHKAPFVGQTRIALNDPNLFFSPYNWFLDGTQSAITTQPGAYLTVGFQSPHISLDIDTSALASLPSSAMPVLRWQIDKGPLQSYQFAAGTMEIPLNLAPLADGKHLCKVWFVAADYRQDRWIVPVEAVRITGLTLDAGGTTVAPTLQNKRILFFGDSITEGERTESALHGPTHDDDATHAFPYSCANALGAEFGVVGVSRQGWTIAGYDSSNVPTFPAAWSMQFADKRREFAPEPDYVVVVQGVNDQNAEAKVAQVQAAIQSWLEAARTAMPTSRLCLVVPFSGFEREAITQAVHAYKAAHLSDSRVFLIDLGASAQAGLSDPSGASSPRSHDGLHPDAATSQALGTQLAAAIQSVAP
ncbi:MAG: lysophospholipase L1-like esterase [Chthonomonadales bacterium]|nr:lysophospholipase L1-like esterase [Chthonomonadales bacterium]